MSRSLPSLVGRLLRWQIVSMVLAWLVLLGWLMWQMNAYGNGDLDRRMGYFATILAEAAAGASAHPEDLERRVQAVERVFVSGVIETLDNAAPYLANYQVIDGQGKVLMRSGSAPAVPWLSARGFAELQDGGQHLRAVRVSSADGTIAVVVAESDATRRGSLLPLLSIVGASQLIIMAFCAIALWISARLSLQPLQRLANRIAARAVGDLTPLDSKGAYREVAPVVDAFNGLLHRESVRMDTERGFLADAAHELRTPLAVIAAQAHRLVEADGPEPREAAVRGLEHGVHRASHLLTQLLTTARIDASQAFARTESMDLAALLGDRLAAIYPIARRKAITLSLDAPGHVPVTANPTGLGSIIDNLIDNAIRYTPEGGNVRVSLREVGGDLELEVSDDGPGIAQEFRERVFERFFRVPGTAQEGSGLGLAIVKRLTTAYGGQIHLGHGPEGRGLTVRLALPAIARS